MSATWNSRFATWAQAPSQTESDKIDNAITAIRKALAADVKRITVARLPPEERKDLAARSNSTKLFSAQNAITVCTE